VIKRSKRIRCHGTSLERSGVRHDLDASPGKTGKEKRGEQRAENGQLPCPPVREVRSKRVLVGGGTLRDFNVTYEVHCLLGRSRGDSYSDRLFQNARLTRSVRFERGITFVAGVIKKGNDRASRMVGPREKGS